MHKQIINPWSWQDQPGYAQPVEVGQHSSVLYYSGQAAMDAAGRPVSGDMAAQIALSLQNVESVIREAGYAPASIVRLNFHTTSVTDLFGSYSAIAGWTKQHGLTPSGTLTEVTALAFPG